MTAKVHPGVVLQWECLMKHYQSKYQPPLLRFVVGFLAGLAAWTQMFSACCQSWRLLGEKKSEFCSGSPNISGGLTLVLTAHTYTQSCKKATVKCRVCAGPCWSLTAPATSRRGFIEFVPFPYFFFFLPRSRIGSFSFVARKNGLG